MAIQIRPAGPVDFESIEVIENQADQLLIERLQPDEWEPATAAASRVSEPGYVLVAEIDSGTLVGFAHVIEADGAAHLEQLAVLPAYGRHGYGRSLVEAAKVEARHRGYSRITLRTYADVPWNAPFYAQVGFIEEEPATTFHKGLVESEALLGLERYGRRIQMAAELR